MKPNPSVEATRSAETPPVVPLEYLGQEDAASVPPQSRGRRPRVSSARFATAWMIAGLSDMLSIGFTFATPLQWGLDLATAAALFVVLGWRWMLLPALILEAIPGISALPFWVLVVTSIATWDTPRAK